MVDFNKIQENLSKLTGNWQEWAKEADEQAGEMKDGVYLNSAFEIDYIKNKALSSGVNKQDVVSVFQGLGIEESEMDGIMDGTFLKNAQKAGERDAKESRVVNADAQKHVLNTYIADAAKAFTKTGDWDEMAKAINDRIKNEIHANPEYYTKLGEQVQLVLNAFKEQEAVMTDGKEIDSKEEVMTLFRTVSNNLKPEDGDEFKEFKQQLIESFGTLAEARQLQKETDRVNHRFLELANPRKTEAEAKTELLKDAEIDQEYAGYINSGMAPDAAWAKVLESNPNAKAKFDGLTKCLSREDALKQVVAEFKDKGSYYSDFKGFSVRELAHKDELYKDEAGRTIIPEHKGILSDMDDKVVMKHASDEINRIIQDLKKQKGENDEELTAKDIEKAVEAQLKANGTYDKYAKKYMRGRTEMSTAEILRFEKSPYKYNRKNAAATRRANAIMAKSFTYVELREQVKDTTFVQRILNKDVTLLDEKGDPVKDESGEYVKIKAIARNDDGTFNIEGLSMFIRRTIGKDLMASAEPDKINTYDEIANVARGLGVSKKEAKHLIKMCGYDIESKNWAKVFMDAFVDTVTGYIPGAAVATLGLASNIGNQIIAGQTFNFLKEFMVAHLKYTNDQSWKIDINVDGMDVEFDEEALITQLKTQAVNYTYWDEGAQAFVTTQRPLNDFFNYDIEAGKITLTYNKPSSGEINLFGKVDENATTPDRTAKEAGIDAKESLPIQLLKGFAVAYALNVLKEALKTQGTTPILNPDFDTTMSMDDYIEAHIKNNSNIKDPKLKTALIGLVKNFIPTTIDANGQMVQGKWDAQAYRDMLSTIAGPSSHLTAVELRDYLDGILPKTEPKKVEPPVVEKKPVIPPEENDKSETPQSENRYGITTDGHIDVTHTDWDNIVVIYGDKAFPPDKDGGRKFRTRMFKVMQGMEDTSLTIEQIQLLAKISMTDIKNVKRVKNPKTGKMEIDIEDYAKKAQTAFEANPQAAAFLTGENAYKFDYTQFAKSIRGDIVGDNKNLLTAPEILYWNDDDQVGVKRADFENAKRRYEGGGTGNDRGNVHDTGTGHVAPLQADGSLGTSRRTTPREARSNGYVHDPRLGNK